MNNLKEYREKNNITIKEFANWFKVSQYKVKAWEADTATPTIEQLQSMSYLYDCSLNDLMPYTKPDPYEFPARRAAVRKKYMKRFNHVYIGIVVALTVIALLVVLIVRIAPQIHEKSHAQTFYKQTIKMIKEETGEDLETVLYYANTHSDLESSEEYVSSIAVVTWDQKYIVYFHYGKMYGIIDVQKGFDLTNEATMTMNGNSYYMPIGDYANVYYLILYEGKTSLMDDIVREYKVSNGLTDTE